MVHSYKLELVDHLLTHLVLLQDYLNHHMILSRMILSRTFITANLFHTIILYIILHHNFIRHISRTFIRYKKIIYRLVMILVKILISFEMQFIKQMIIDYLYCFYNLYW
jgi:hypothetical protein